MYSAEREEGRLKDEMRRLQLEREDFKEKMNIYEVMRWNAEILLSFGDHLKSFFFSFYVEHDFQNEPACRPAQVSDELGPAGTGSVA